MAKTEKIFYILEQVRLCLDRKDYIRWDPLVHYFVELPRYQSWVI